MRLDGYFSEGVNPNTIRHEGAAMPFGTLAFWAVGFVPTSQWAEIYRIAYERTVEALRPTRYDRAFRATAN
jgi:hypothetical protein